MRYWFLVLFLITLNTTNAAVYVYELPDGGTLLTNQKLKKFKLKTKFKVTSPSKRRAYFSKPLRPLRSKFDKVITSVSNKYNIDPAFIKAVIHTESAFNPNAVSKKGALGLMQLMPKTAAFYDIQLKDRPFDPQLNITAGVRHIYDLMIRFEDNKELCLAAYNAGVGAVQKYGGIPPYKETTMYVHKVMKLYAMYSGLSI